ncbi:MAG: M48 family metallopeptidase [Planktomarina sp.]
MFTLVPIVLAVLYGLAMYHFSVWRTRKSLAAQSTPLRNPDLQKALMPLAAALDLPAIKVRVYHIAAINGLATTDGEIYITDGFIERYRRGEISANEIASVIAHELGHVALGHTRRRMIDFSGQNAMRTALALILGRIIPGVGVYVAGILSNLLAAGMSRVDEFEADAYATALMVKAGLGATPQKSMFRKLDMLTGQRHATPAWFMSHPKTEDRIKAIEANEVKWGIA